MGETTVGHGHANYKDDPTSLEGPYTWIKHCHFLTSDLGPHGSL